ncbi:ATP-binding cassette domain-containing protein, partial [Pantoea ananatis]
MLTLNNLTYLYQHLPMRFSLHAGRGERLAILGPSGAGKSTLLNLIAGFLPVSQGSLTINGVDHTNSVPAQRPVSMLFQENNLFPHLSVEQNLGLGLHPGLKLTSDQRQQVTTIAQQVGLSEMLSRLPGQLSGGQRQRVALARCLLRDRP